MDKEFTLTLFEEDLGFPRETLQKYIRDPQEARDFIMKGGRPLLAEVIIKNWASHYFRRDMKVSTVTNQAGFDITSTDGEIAIEVKTCWKPDKNYISFKSIGQKKNNDGTYAFTHIAFYSPLLDPNGVVLFTRKQFENEIILPPAGKLNIKIDLNKGHNFNTCYSSSVAFRKYNKWM